MVGGRTFSHHPVKRNKRALSLRRALLFCVLTLLASQVNPPTTGKTQSRAEAATQAIAEAERLKTAPEISARLAAISKYSEAQRLFESAGELRKAADAQ